MEVNDASNVTQLSEIRYCSSPHPRRRYPTNYPLQFGWGDGKRFVSLRRFERAAELATRSLQEVGPGSIERTPRADARVMLASMLPAMEPADASGLLALLPPELQHELRPLLERNP